jgi:hypothetical protein
MGADVPPRAGVRYSAMRYKSGGAYAIHAWPEGRDSLTEEDSEDSDID